MNQVWQRLSVQKVVSLVLVVAIACTPLGCSDPVPERAQADLEAFLNDTNGPPEPQPRDMLMRGKADVIALPAISVAVWAIGALIVYIGGQTVLTNTVDDFEVVLRMALGQSNDWSWAEDVGEPLNQADHLTEALNRIAYRSETSDFYSINGNDYLRFLTMASPITLLDPKKLKDLLDGKVRPWGEHAREYFRALQVASVRARHLTLDDTARGLCARATVYSKTEPRTPYVGLARSTGAGDVIPAAVFASLKATMRCGMYDAEIREFVYSYYNVDGPRASLPDIFISHMLKTARLIYRYAETCQLPPNVQVTPDAGDCHDATIH